MFGRLMPREGNFFELFNSHAERIVEGSHELAAMITSFTEVEKHAEYIDAAERAADKITHETITLLHKTFITPFDREQIHQLITRMDESRQLAEICQMCCERVRTAVSLLKNVKDAEAILKTCQEIDRLESDADRVMRSAMSKLFRDESDVKQLIKLRTIYELLEQITDRCEDVANIIEGIVLENS
jgi:uncharacterized protein Yka (UPF0111/DUF47 family)